MQEKTAWLLMSLSTIWFIVSGCLCVIFGGADVNLIVIGVTFFVYAINGCILMIRADTRKGEEFI